MSFRIVDLPELRNLSVRHHHNKVYWSSMRVNALLINTSSYLNDLIGWIAIHSQNNDCCRVPVEVFQTFIICSRNEASEVKVCLFALCGLCFPLLISSFAAAIITMITRGRHLTRKVDKGHNNLS